MSPPHADLCEGKDRAVLSLFYNLSQFKRNPSSGSSSSPAPAKSAPHPSRIARPTSPSLKAVHGVNINGPSVSAPPQASSPQSPPQKEVTLSVASMSPPATSPVSPNPSTHKMGLGGPRRTAGSSIMTSTTFDRSYMHRKPVQKSRNGEEVPESKPSPTSEEPPTSEGGRARESPRANGQLSMSDSHTAEVKSDPENDENSSKQTAKTAKLSKHSSFSFGHSSLPHSRLLKPGASKGTAVAEKAESATPPTQSKLKGPIGGGKLQAPAQKASKDSEPEAGGSRLKFPGSGRSTPSNQTRSGIQRPSSRLSKMGSSSTSNLAEGEEEGGASKLKLQRKASDGAVKRHLVVPSTSKSSIPGHAIQSGTSSLPRHLPKGSLSPRQPGKGMGFPHEDQESKTAEVSTSNSEGKPERKLERKPDEKTGGKSEGAKQAPPAKDAGGEKSGPLKAEGSGFGLKKPSGGLKKPGASLLSGVRTPNLPSSGPQSSSTTSSQGEPERGHTPQGEEGVAGGSPSTGKKLMQPKASTGGMKQPSTLESRLKRATSPSAKHKLHRIDPAGTGHAPSRPSPSESKDSHTLLNGGGAVEAGLNSSSSSLDSELHGGTPTSQGGVLGQPALAEKTVAPKSVEKAEPEKPLEKPPAVNKDSGDVVAPPTDVKTTPTDVKEESGKEGHLRFGRRISPEGMSHEEISSPKGEAPAEEDKPRPQTPPSKEDPLVSSGDTDSTTSTEKELVAVGDGMGGDSHQSRYQDAESAEPSLGRGQRARSLSPKSPNRLLPKGMTRVRDLENGGPGLTRTASSESTSSEGGSGGTPSLSRKPLKSSLRQKRGGSGGPKSRHSSSSSLEGIISPSGPRPKVTISPRSSQVSR